MRAPPGIVVGVTSPERIRAVLGLLGHAQRTADLDALDHATEGLDRADRELPPRHPFRVSVLGNLGEALRQRYELRGDRRDLQAAIGAQQRALELIAPGDPRRPVVLRSLSVLRQTRVQRYGGDHAAEEARLAAELATAAVDESDPADPRWPVRLQTLAAAQRLQYQFDGSSEPLADAIDTARRACAAAPGDPMAAAHLAEILRTAHLSGVNTDTVGLDLDLDLAEAVGAAERAVEASAPGSPEHAARSALLARILLDRGTPADVDRAIDLSRRAATATLRSAHPNAQVVHTAAMALARRPDARPEAIPHAELALDLTAADDPARAPIEVTLGDWTSEDDPVGAAGHYRTAAGRPGAAPSVRCDAARKWALSALAAGDLAEAGTAYGCAVALLPTTAPHLRHEGWTGLAGEAAATALRQDDPALALRLLEQVRGVLHARSLGTEVDAVRPELAERLAILAALLDRPAD
jgi:hypothetical protein